MSDESPGEIAHYSNRTSNPRLWMPVGMFLIFSPFLAGFIVAGLVPEPYRVIPMISGLLTSYIIGRLFFDQILTWTAFLLMHLFPRKPEDDV